ncbi:oligopeptide ABC transporter ATP-binding protein, partial [Streptomyces anulatus]
KCATEPPPLLDTGDGHTVARHHTPPIDPGTVKQTLATGIEAVIGTETVAAEAVETAEAEAPAEKPAKVEAPAEEPAKAEAPAEEPATVPAQADADATEQTEDSPKA